MARNFKIHQTKEDATQVKELYINFKPSVHIFSGLGENFPNLIFLIICDQLIKFVERENFFDLQKLGILDLSGNKIEVLPEDVFMDLPNLRYLYFDINLITNIPEKLFSDLRRIEYISFYRNHIKVLPSNLFLNNLRLESLKCYNNPLKTADVDFSAIPNVKLWNETESKHYFRGNLVNRSY